MSFMHKTCQTVAGISMDHQFHDFLNLILIGFLKFGPTVFLTQAETLQSELSFAADTSTFKVKQLLLIFDIGNNKVVHVLSKY
jgi:hypothetical protein